MLRWVQGHQSWLLQPVWLLQVPRRVRALLCWRVFPLPALLRARPLGHPVPLRASLGVLGPVLLSKALAQLKLVHVQSKTDQLAFLQLARVMACRSSAR